MLRGRRDCKPALSSTGGRKTSEVPKSGQRSARTLGVDPSSWFLLIYDDEIGQTVSLVSKLRLQGPCQDLIGVPGVSAYRCPSRAAPYIQPLVLLKKRRKVWGILGRLWRKYRAKLRLCEDARHGSPSSNMAHSSPDECAERLYAIMAMVFVYKLSLIDWFILIFSGT